MSQPGFLNTLHLVSLLYFWWSLRVRVPHHSVVRLLISSPMLRYLSRVTATALLMLQINTSRFLLALKPQTCLPYGIFPISASQAPKSNISKIKLCPYLKTASPLAFHLKEEHHSLSHCKAEILVIVFGIALL